MPVQTRTSRLGNDGGHTYSSRTPSTRHAATEAYSKKLLSPSPLGRRPPLTATMTSPTLAHNSSQFHSRNFSPYNTLRHGTFLPAGLSLFRRRSPHWLWLSLTVASAPVTSAASLPASLFQLSRPTRATHGVAAPEARVTGTPVHARHGGAPPLRRSHGLPRVRAKPRSLLAFLATLKSSEKSNSPPICKWVRNSHSQSSSASKEIQKKLRSNEGWIRTCDP